MLCERCSVIILVATRSGNKKADLTSGKDEITHAGMYIESVLQFFLSRPALQFNALTSTRVFKFDFYRKNKHAACIWSLSSDPPLEFLFNALRADRHQLRPLKGVKMKVVSLIERLCLTESMWMKKKRNNNNSLNVIDRH